MTVRIKKDGNAEVVEADDACKLEAIKILDEMLEDYVGIRDKELCQERRFFDCFIFVANLRRWNDFR